MKGWHRSPLCVIFTEPCLRKALSVWHKWKFRGGEGTQVGGGTAPESSVMSSPTVSLVFSTPLRWPLTSWAHVSQPPGRARGEAAALHRSPPLVKLVTWGAIKALCHKNKKKSSVAVQFVVSPATAGIQGTEWLTGVIEKAAQACATNDRESKNRAYGIKECKVCPGHCQDWSNLNQEKQTDLNRTEILCWLLFLFCFFSRHCALNYTWIQYILQIQKMQHAGYLKGVKGDFQP